jgi:hypothetical protein
MNEVLVIFSVAATGCLTHLAMDLAVQFFARRMPSGRIAVGPGNGQASRSQAKADSTVTLGATLGCYGVIALMIVTELPGALAVQRTWLAFALMCVGGLIGEISRSGTCKAVEDADAEEGEEQEQIPGSVGLSVALMIALNLAVAVLMSGQGLVQLVPPSAPAVDNQSTQLEQIVVVARKGKAGPAELTFL